VATVGLMLWTPVLTALGHRHRPRMHLSERISRVFCPQMTQSATEGVTSVHDPPLASSNRSEQTTTTNTNTITEHQHQHQHHTVAYTNTTHNRPCVSHRRDQDSPILVVVFHRYLASTIFYVESSPAAVEACKESFSSAGRRCLVLG
jgi:hypothetical protein